MYSEKRDNRHALPIIDSSMHHMKYILIIIKCWPNGFIDWEPHLYGQG